MSRSPEVRSAYPLVVLGENIRTGYPPRKIRKMDSSGKQPLSPYSKMQARAAAELATKVDFPSIIFSSADTSQVGVSEARAMFEYANKPPELRIQKAVGRVICEEKSNNTETNAVEVAKILQRRNSGVMMVNLLVPHFHESRAVDEFRRQGINVINVYHPDEVLAENAPRERDAGRIFNPDKFITIYRSLPQVRKEYKREKILRFLLKLPSGRLLIRAVTSLQRKKQ